MIGFLGMGWAIIGASIIMLLVIGHLFMFRITEEKIFSIHSDEEQPNKKINIKETLRTINAIP